MRTLIGAAVALSCLSFTCVAASADTALDTEAITALQPILSLTDCVEHGGAIIQTPHGYRITEPVTGTAHNVNYMVPLYAGEHIAALYHTHPKCESNTRVLSEYFSPADIATAQRLGVPSYIGVQWSHNVRRLDPGALHLVDMPREQGQTEWQQPRVTQGVLVAVVP